MSLFAKITQGLSQISSLFSNENADSIDKSNAATNGKSNLGSNIFDGRNPLIKNFNDSGLVATAKNTLPSIENSNRQIIARANTTAKVQQDAQNTNYPPYELTITVPEKQETLSYNQLQKTVIKSIFDRNGIGYSNASIEEIAGNEKLDFSPKYDYANKKYEYSKDNGLFLKVKPEKVVIDGKQQRVVRLLIDSKLQAGIVGNKALSETIKASGKKTFAELNINERMSMAMQMAYDKHYLPHNVKEALQDIDPKQLMAGVAIAGGILYAARNGAAAKILPIVGTGITVAQVGYYYSLADSFLQECAKAKSPEDLDIAAKDFAKLIKQGGVELTVTLATAGVSQLGKISRAGGAVVGHIERGTIAAYNKLGKVTDEVLTGMRQANGDNLAYETATIRPVVNQADDAANASVKQATAKPAQTADDLSQKIVTVDSNGNPSGTRFRNDYDTHIKNREFSKASQKTGVNGAHDMAQLEQYSIAVNSTLTKNSINIVNKTPHPTIKGIYKIEYQMPALDRMQNLTGGWRNKPFVKTVYDSSIISDKAMLQWGREAFADAFQKGSFVGNKWTGTARNGLEFQGFVDAQGTSAVRTFFPIF